MADGSGREAGGDRRDERPAERPGDGNAGRDASRSERLYRWLDARLGLDGAKGVLGKAFPAEDSFLLGEVALFCFLVLVLTGVFLGFFFEPSTSEVTYQGSVDRYQGDELPEAFVSVLNITYDVPYGMFLRRMHHWAAHLFVAAIALHMLRVFFTGAYRNPREPNWVVGSGLAVLAMFAAYTGYALPFDEFASTATGIGYNIARSVPLAGDVLSRLVFGGEFPSSATVPRLYFIHVLLVPAAIAVLLGVHMAILVRQKHTEAPRERDLPGGTVTSDGGGPTTGRGTNEPAASAESSDVDTAGDDGPGTDGPTATDGGAAAAGRTRVARDDDSVIVGLPAFPNQAAVSAVVFFLTFATLSLLAGFLPVHNVAQYGPNDPASTPGLIMPDWFLMWLYGFLKLLPSWLSFTVAGVHVSTEFVGGVVLPSLVFAVIVAWPFIDYHPEPVHFTADPIERPWQTAAGVAAVVFVMLASLAGMNNLVADVTGTTTDVVNPVLLVLVVLGPMAAGLVVYRTLGGSLRDLRDRLPGVAGRRDGDAGAGPGGRDDDAGDSDTGTGRDGGDGS